MTAQARPILPPRTTTFHLSGRGFGWWCDTCNTGYDQYTPSSRWCDTKTGAQTLADKHICDR